MWVAISALAIVLAAGAVVQALCARTDRRRFSPPGRLVNGLHVRDVGTNGPPVVFEAGLAATRARSDLIRCIAGELPMIDSKLYS